MNRKNIFIFYLVLQCHSVAVSQCCSVLTLESLVGTFLSKCAWIPCFYRLGNDRTFSCWIHEWYEKWGVGILWHYMYRFWSQNCRLIYRRGSSCLSKGRTLYKRTTGYLFNSIINLSPFVVLFINQIHYVSFSSFWSHGNSDFLSKYVIFHVRYWVIYEILAKL